MQRYLDPERAARLAGVSHDEIWRHVEDGSLDFVKGKVEVSALRRLYPDVSSKKTGMVEVVSQIRDDAAVTALDKRINHKDIKSLIADLRSTQQQLDYYRRKAQLHKQCIADLRGMLISIKARLEKPQQVHVENVLNWLRQKMKENR